MSGRSALEGAIIDLSYGISTTSDGWYIVTGYTISANGGILGNHGVRDMWVVKLDPESLFANFTIPITTGIAPLTVQFTDISTSTNSTITS